MSEGAPSGEEIAATAAVAAAAKSEQGSPVKRRRRYLTIEEKAKIVEEAFSKPRAVMATARRYGVSAKMVREWKNKLENGGKAVLKRMAGKKKTMHAGPRTQYKEVYDHLEKFVEELRARRMPVSTVCLREEMEAMFPHMCGDQFKVRNRGLLDRFCQRLNIVYRNKKVQGISTNNAAEHATPFGQIQAIWLAVVGGIEERH
mmetsp:Transcript_5740/g.17097  ORF Transcript_5740/g.17097 Transcript_5740/m.17097 type:complete len:202 (-) Transcript_5740:646-1251(-)